MRRVIVSIGLLFLCSSAALAEGGAATTGADLASFLGSLRAGDSCLTPTEAASRPGVTPQSVTCTADCGPYTDVTCTVSGSCSAVDRNCSIGQRGYIVCNGAYTYCPVCACIENDVRYQDNGCCVGGYVRTDEYTCLGGVWMNTATYCDGVCLP